MLISRQQKGTQLSPSVREWKMTKVGLCLLAVRPLTALKFPLAGCLMECFGAVCAGT